MCGLRSVTRDGDLSGGLTCEKSKPVWSVMQGPIIFFPVGETACRSFAHLQGLGLWIEPLTPDLRLGLAPVARFAGLELGSIHNHRNL